MLTDVCRRYSTKHVTLSLRSGLIGRDKRMKDMEKDLGRQARYGCQLIGLRSERQRET